MKTRRIKIIEENIKWLQERVAQLKRLEEESRITIPGREATASDMMTSHIWVTNGEIRIPASVTQKDIVESILKHLKLKIVYRAASPAGVELEPESKK